MSMGPQFMSMEPLYIMGGSIEPLYIMDGSIEPLYMSMGPQFMVPSYLFEIWMAVALIARRAAAANFIVIFSLVGFFYY